MRITAPRAVLIAVLLILAVGAACSPVIFEDGSWYVPSEPSDGDITERRLYVGGCVADMACDQTPGWDHDNQPEILWCITDAECSIVSGVFDTPGYEVIHR